MQTATPPLKVLLVDGPCLVRTAIRLLIEHQPNMELAGVTGDPEEAHRLTLRESPDVILLEAEMPSGCGLELLKALAKAGRGSKVIALTRRNDPDLLLRAVSLGALGIVGKDQTEEELLMAIRKVSEGEVWIERSLTSRALSEIARKSEIAHAEGEKIAALTPREREVIALIGEGLKNRHIADRLFIGEGTVRHHLRIVFQKLDVTDRLELVIYAFKYGLVALPTASAA